MFTAVLLGLAAPLKASHILWINLITDSLPALALGVDENDKEALMREPPRSAKEGMFANGGAQWADLILRQRGQSLQGDPPSAFTAL